MAKAATSEDLRSGFEAHLEQTRGHIQRLEQIFKALGEKPTGKKCKGMEGLIAEGQEMMGEDFEDDVMDAALISAAQRVEHYEIAAYGTVRTYAELLGEDEAAQLLEQTLEEEKETDQKLTDLASEINVKAMGEGSEKTPAKRKKKKQRRLLAKKPIVRADQKPERHRARNRKAAAPGRNGYRSQWGCDFR